MINIKRHITSLVLKAVLSLVSLNGVFLMLLQDNFTNWSSLLYFTAQSNIWIGIYAILAFIFLLIETVTQKPKVPKWLEILQLVFTVSIAITGLIFCFVLAPTSGQNIWTPTNVLVHMLAPVLAIVDYFVSLRHFRYQKFSFFYATIPFLYYLGLSAIGYLAKWDYGQGNHYPYFFLNFGSPVGFFGFSSQAPYWMGTFYWIIVILAICLGLSFLFQWLANRLNRVKQ
ncbi:MAG: hypothetical protein WC201_02670 [Bacilli bacterium]